MPEDTVDIAALFRAKQEEMAAVLLSTREVIKHPTQKGAASELSWQRLLAGYLPARYKVSSGSVVDVHGKVSDQIDLLLLDNQYSPVLFDIEGVQYFPAESVYAAFEIKQEVNKDFIEYAGAKVESVRKLHRTSARIAHAGGEYEPKDPMPIIGGLLSTDSAWNPPLGDAFERSLRSLTGERRLNIGCVMKHGAFIHSGDGDQGVLRKSTAELALVFFVFRLLEVLQGMATVPAINYSEWLRHAE